MRKQERASPNRADMPEPIAEDGANPEVATCQTVPVMVAWRLTGGLLALTATASGLGQSYSDRWSISPPLACTSATVADASGPGRGCYVSRAVVAASALAPDTTYTFSYAIVIRGRQGVRAGGGSVALSTGPAASGDACLRFC